jgi:ankyrin repeat protein
MTKQLDFHLAILENDTETFKKLINSSFINPAFDYRYFVGYDSKKWIFRFLGKLFKLKSAKTPNMNNCAIVSSSEKGYIEFVELLLNDKRVDPSANSNLALIKAIENGHLEIVKLLLNNNKVNTKLNKKNIQSAFLIAIENGELDVIDFLLSNKYINPSFNNEYPLISSAWNGKEEIL